MGTLRKHVNKVMKTCCKNNYLLKGRKLNSEKINSQTNTYFEQTITKKK